MAEQANAQLVYELTEKEAAKGVSCPSDDVALWNSHPKVFLPLKTVGEHLCPYCSAKYIVKDA